MILFLRVLDFTLLGYFHLKLHWICLCKQSFYYRNVCYRVVFWNQVITHI